MAGPGAFRAACLAAVAALSGWAGGVPPEFLLNFEMQLRVPELDERRYRLAVSPDGGVHDRLWVYPERPMVAPSRTAARAMLTRIDHVYLSVSDFDRSEAFYDRVMARLGQHKGDAAVAGERHAHYVGPQFQLTIRPARTDVRHDPYAPGLHHLCFQVASKVDVYECYRRLDAIGVDATEPRVYPEYHPDYFATFFSDPDGVRLEIVNVTPHRVALEERWSELTTFLNPLSSDTSAD